jgi:hypothetical protein
MDCIDLSLFRFEPFQLKLSREGEAYTINFIPAMVEVELFDNGTDHVKKIQDMKTITSDDIEIWRMLLKQTLIENKNNVNESEIDSLGRLELVPVMSKLLQIVTKKSNEFTTILHKIYGIEDDSKKN